MFRSLRIQGWIRTRGASPTSPFQLRNQESSTMRKTINLVVKEQLHLKRSQGLLADLRGELKGRIEGRLKMKRTTTECQVLKTNKMSRWRQNPWGMTASLRSRLAGKRELTREQQQEAISNLISLRSGMRPLMKTARTSRRSSSRGRPRRRRRSPGSPRHHLFC